MLKNYLIAYTFKGSKENKSTLIKATSKFSARQKIKAEKNKVLFHPENFIILSIKEIVIDKKEIELK